MGPERVYPAIFILGGKKPSLCLLAFVTAILYGCMNAFAMDSGWQSVGCQ